MNHPQTIAKQLLKQKLLPLFYHSDKSVCMGILTALYNAGIRCVEFTNRGSQALANFEFLISVRDRSMPDLFLGIGTIQSTEDVIQFSQLRADFLISPIFDLSIAEQVKKQQILWVPGCMSVTEVHLAQKNGYKLIKLFPGNVLGPDYVASIVPLYPGLQFFVTGGVDISQEKIKAWFDSGVSGVGLGSKLITKEILANQDYQLLTTNTQEILRLVASF
ncbi:MAG: bifunctional 4-hydroxy-2-oxoglutarate aldolase/2-dehydro-3-deoxy-phosphogluconate aldolase [Flammeovirgaceae bacterium]|jgi:2-dehydro-3-deoxyphosphogluconate aldolase / (4S)-4-hydroxy-2-oxoglutarate aldolase|nr:bifunctional 4-hydroxy-2-oxoglutarate aldolase/2-dehydro-3-deoxy-phosphogluconate aldolase [Flammeovirgaceae bacterium]|tara:strand:+ start:12329 stop:12985 length:657 start_codon:yes stop_codon:yes gene_type:complete